MEEPLAMLDMEERLKDDTDGVYLKEILDRLAVSSDEIKKALDQGLPPDEFQVMGALKDAVQDASKVVKSVWESIHS
jgi:type III secretion system YseE family protein